MELVKLEIFGLSAGHSQKGTYTLIMGVEDGHIKLPIVIGAYEAQSIAVVMENIKPQRPLTHDLFKDIFDQFKLELEEVRIDKLEEGVFFAKLWCSSDDHKVVIDARSSDAIALAIRFNCPVYTTKEILNDAGIVMEELDEEGPERPDYEPDYATSELNEWDKFDLDELEKMLDEAIQVEDYDKAAIIRDEISKRRKN